VDRDAAQIGRVFQPDVSICGDIRAVMEDVFDVLEADGMPPKSRERSTATRPAPRSPRTTAPRRRSNPSA
jgi:acetolactate synthase I/II/III large subunit